MCVCVCVGGGPWGRTVQGVKVSCDTPGRGRPPVPVDVDAVGATAVVAPVLAPEPGVLPREHVAVNVHDRDDVEIEVVQEERDGVVHAISLNKRLHREGERGGRKPLTGVHRRLEVCN